MAGAQSYLHDLHEEVVEGFWSLLLDCVQNMRRRGKAFV